MRAQDLPPGLVATLDVTQRFEHSDNPDLDENGKAQSFGRALVNFGLRSITKVQAFSLNLGTEIEQFRRDQSSDFDPTNSSVVLGYDRNTRNAVLGVEGTYINSDTDGEITEGELDQDGNVIRQTEGTREFYNIGVETTVGRDAPISANFAWRYSELKFSGRANAGLDDSSTNSLSGQIDFRINPSVTANLTARYIDFNARDGGVDRKTTGFGAGVNLRLSPIWSTSVSLRYDNIDRSGGESGSDNGITGIVNVTRDMPNGSLGLRFETDVSSNENGRRSFLSVSRSMELPRGALSFSVGATGAGNVIGTDPLVNVNYTQDRSTQQFRVGLSQRVITDTDNEEQLNTSLNASFSQRINNRSSFGVDFSLFDRNELGKNADDGRRFTVGVTYRHDLTRDWGLVGGYSYTHLKDDDSSNRDRNTVFVGLQRSFRWSP